MTPRIVVIEEREAAIHLTRQVVGAAFRVLGHDRHPFEIMNALTDFTGSKDPGQTVIRAAQSDFDGRIIGYPEDTRFLVMGTVALQMTMGAHKRPRMDEHLLRMRWLWEGDDDPRGPVWVPTHSAKLIVTDKGVDSFTDVVDALGKLLAQDAPLPQVTRADVDWRVDTIPSLAMAALAELELESTVSCDIETMGLDANEDALLSVGFGTILPGGRTRVRIVRGDALEDPQVIDAIWDRLYRTSAVCALHNGKFDLQFLMRHFGEDRVPQDVQIVDTMLAHHQIDERPVGFASHGMHRLKGLAMAYYDEPDYSHDIETFQGKVRDGSITAEEWEEFDWYHARDCHFTIRLWTEFREVLDHVWGEQNDMTALDFHMGTLGPVSNTVAALELQGTPVDLPRIHELMAIAADEVEGLDVDLAVRARALGSGGPVDLESSRQVATFLYVTLGIPKPKISDPKSNLRRKSKEPPLGTDKPHLLAVANWARDEGREDIRDWVMLLLDRRASAKDLSSFLGPLEPLVRPRAGWWRVHPSFFLAGSVTGRISIHDPALQTYPGSHSKATGRTTRTKTVFAPMPGWTWIEADYSQLELRVAAMLSRDESMISAYVRGADLHAEVAAAIFDMPISEVTEGQRFMAKAVDFGLLYGRSGWAIAQDQDLQAAMLESGTEPPTEAEADDMIATFYDAYPGVSAWVRGQETKALTRGEVSIGIGRKRRFLWQDKNPNNHSARRMMRMIRNRARNSPVQGLASDLMLDAMARIHPRLPEGAEAYFPVHDSLNLGCHEDLRDEVIAIVREEMLAGPSWLDQAGCPLAVDVKAGPNWGETGKV